MSKTLRPKKITLAECDALYKKTVESYQAYITKTAETEFGGFSKAASAVKRSRTHLFYCVKGYAALDSVRRLARNLANAVSDLPGKRSDFIDPWAEK